MSNINFVCDEDVDARLVKFLKEKGINIAYTEKGLTNSKLYSFACEKGRAILSRDKDFLNTTLFSASKIPAIVVMRIHPPILSKLQSLLLDFISKFSNENLGKTWELREEGAVIVG